MRKALAQSALFHALALAAWLASGLRPEPPPVSSSSGPIEVSVATGRSSGPGPRGESLPTARGRRGSPRTPETPSLQDLRLSPARPGHETSDSPRGGGTDGFEGFSLAESMSAEKEADLYPFFRELWQRIDASTGYPPDFVNRRVTGSVDVQLEIRDDGVFTGRFVRAESEEPLLQAYVMAVLAHALREPLRLRADREKLVIVTRFDFKVFGIGEAPRKSDPDQFRNLLYFSRSAYADPKLKEEIERILTKYVPPIIPIPGGFYIDFIQAYRMVRDWGKPDAREMRDARIELMRERWQGAVRKAQEGSASAE
jgi:hypothetical protein